MELKIISKSVVPDRIVLFEGDTGGKNLVFSIKKVNDGISVEGLTGYLEIERDEGGSDRFLLEKTFGEDEVYFTLEVNSALTQTEDILSSQISLENEDKSIIYKSKVFFIEVKYSVDGDGSFEQVVPSVITSLENKLTEAVSECNKIKESLDFDKEEIESTLKNDYQLKESQNLETESKEIVGAINEIFNELKNSSGIKTIEPDENGEYKCHIMEMEDGIYYLPANTTVQYTPDGTTVYRSRSCYLFISTDDNDSKIFTIINSLYRYLGYGRETANDGTYAELSLNTIPHRTSENTFTKLQRISAEIPEDDNSTNIVTSAWVNSKLSGISGSGLKWYKHTMSFNMYYGYYINDDFTEEGYDSYTVNFLSPDDTLITSTGTSPKEWYVLPQNAIFESGKGTNNDYIVYRGCFTDKYFNMGIAMINDLYSFSTEMFLDYQSGWGYDSYDTVKFEFVSSSVEEI